MVEVLSSASLPAVVALIIAVAGFILTQTRSAAKTTVDILSVQYQSSLEEIRSLRDRVTFIEQEKIAQLKEFNEERRKLQEQIELLMRELAKSTTLIRNDVRENTEISKAAFHEANDAKRIITIVQSEGNDNYQENKDRLDKLETKV